MRKISRAEEQFTQINFRTAKDIVDDVAKGVANAAGSVNNDIAQGINAVGKGVADVVGGGDNGAANAAKSDLKSHPVAPTPAPANPKAQPTYPDTDRAQDIASGKGPDPHDPTENDPTKGDPMPAKKVTPKPGGDDNDVYDKQLDAAKNNKAVTPQNISFMKQEDNAADIRNRQKPEYPGFGTVPIPTGNNSNAQGSVTSWTNPRKASFNERYAKEEGKTFTPPKGVQSAAKHALELIEQGKAGDGFTSVGRGRAHQLANGESLSLSTVKRMHSYFSRHRVDKKGKDWDNDSPGKVAWLAWGGDAGASWAASIVKKHGDGDSKKKEASLDFNERYASEKIANQYIEKQGDSWVITQKGTGKVLSHHDSKEKAEESFAAMMAHKHGNVALDPSDWRNEYFNLDADW